MSLNQSILDRVKSFQGLYDPENEHDSCGVGFVASIKGERSEKILRTAIDCVRSLAHRGALDADAKTGDGAGVLTQLPYDLFRPEVEKLGHKLFRDEDLAVGFCYLPKDDDYEQAYCRKIVEDVVEGRKLFVFGWRKVPVNMEVLGDKALSGCPEFEQVLIGKPASLEVTEQEYEQLLYLCRREIMYKVNEARIKHFYIASFSSRTIVYKGLLVSPQLDKFYLDLRNPDFKTALAIYHQRYSTNTFPTWPLAQPVRLLAHNGEINTIQGNRTWVRAREGDMAAAVWGEDVKYMRPIISPGGSDSASLDNAVDMLVNSGRDLLHTMLMLVPAAWEADCKVSPEIKAFYQFHDCLTEAWDGPAALVFSDGHTVAACLDRNGLRPARYKVTKDGLFVLGSEVGLGNVLEKDVIEKGRLAPGEILAVDTVARKLKKNNEIKEYYSRRQPYGQWLSEQAKYLQVAPILREQDGPPADFLSTQVAFGYNEEEIKLILKPMAETGEEATGSMGDDTPLAVLSRQPRLLYTYFKQLFAQVTNPPIDPIRERLVMSVQMALGRSRNWLAESAEHADLLNLKSPLLTNSELEEIRQRPEGSLQSKTLSVLFPAEGGWKALVEEIARLRREAEEAVDAGAALLILSDRGVSADRAAIPMLMAVAGIHHHLIRQGKRMRVGLIAETAEARDVHQFACLIGFGCSAINPYLAYALFVELQARGELKVDLETARRNYQYSLEKGLLKIMSKMGVSTLASYHGSQLFEAIGIHDDVMIDIFNVSSTRIQGMGFKEITEETLHRHALGFRAEAKLTDVGYYRYRREGETHAITPGVTQSLHAFSGIKSAEKANRLEDYKKYVEAVYATQPITLQHMLDIKVGQPIPIDEVESIEDIRRRFTTAGMSLGALSPEAHETLAVAMNRIGGKSNSGEGGEDRTRFTPMENGDSKNSAIKQVASGRFGVNAEYLASAAEIEIKVAQGAKPGEGGALGGNKVEGIIARLRHATPGTPLISPPPHHDIYSIEDLAQLIYDLKQVNPRAKVCVKLVSEAGVGTIAAGVAKAHADIILISGHDGGTGNAPLSSIKNAGGPWELGVAEAQQVLLLNGLRNRVTLRTDGGMRTGRDIVKAALLGAEEFNFGTIALIAAGCVYVRQCHLNTCPVGIASQDQKYRAKYKGTPENIIIFFNGVAQEVREIMAQMGVRTMNELIGHTEWLEQRHIPDHPKANTLDLRRLLAVPEIDDTVSRFHTWERNDKLEDLTLDDVILQAAKSALQTRRHLQLKYKIKNVNRSVGTQLSGEIAYRYGDEGLPPDTISISLEGSAGQSLGAFLINGVRLTLHGEANDFVGKGMSGGEIIVTPSSDSKFVAEDNIIAGNTCLYGATGGFLYVHGRAGERFAVRNSGATAVVEGIGDHGCEYMTNGQIIVLGAIGKNFGAGMSGGTAYLLDEDESVSKSCNLLMVSLENIEVADDIAYLQKMIQQHVDFTQSAVGRRILDQWPAYQGRFRKVVPHKPKPSVAVPAPTPPAAALAKA